MVPRYPLQVNELCFPLERNWVDCLALLRDDELAEQLQLKLSLYILVHCKSNCRQMTKTAYLLKHGMVTQHLVDFRNAYPLSVYDPRRAYNARAPKYGLCYHCAMKAHDLLSSICVLNERSSRTWATPCHHARVTDKAIVA